MQFSVWAPLAQKSVELVCADQRFALAVDAEGYWRADCLPARIAEGYRYSIDGDPPLPDPRSAWQPDGVHGASFLVNVDELKVISRSDFVPKPLREAVIYELHVGT